MDQSQLRALLDAVAAGLVSIDEALTRLRTLPYEDLGFAKLDHHRTLRKGYPETVFCAGKTPEQVVAIVGRMRAHGSNILATRCSLEVADAVLKAYPEAVYHEAARCITLLVAPVAQNAGFLAVVSAGTSDIPVAEEAVVTCESLGNKVERIYDVGVAGLHRLLAQRELLDKANAVIVCAGMEGALPSVVAGLVEKPVIAVPTSVGYGASLGGVAALLAMLNSCSAGIAVVNIDNGFGAGIMASMINRMAANH
jgi:pyridinium-3,5-biscarboxylic acid mononucleotide synthase